MGEDSDEDGKPFIDEDEFETFTYDTSSDGEYIKLKPNTAVEEINTTITVGGIDDDEDSDTEKHVTVRQPDEATCEFIGCSHDVSKRLLATWVCDDCYKSAQKHGATDLREYIQRNLG